MAESLRCMNCNAPIKAGFFCDNCTNAGAVSDAPTSGRSSHKPTARAAQRVDIATTRLIGFAKTLAIVAVIGGLAFGGYRLFQKQINGVINGVRTGTAKHERYDPTKDEQVADDGSGSQSNGKRAFSRKDPAATIDEN